MGDPGTKTLTIRNPWAFEIILGHKDIENRGWKPRLDTPFRLNVHAGKAFDKSAYPSAGLTREMCASRTGALIGFVTVDSIHDGRDCDCSIWAQPSRWHWRLSNAHAIDPIPMPGRLGLWDVSYADPA